jgi:hypothetical protein
MNLKACLAVAATLTLSGCAVLFPPIDTTTTAVANTASRNAVSLASGTPVGQVDVATMKSQVRCEPVTRTGTRIVTRERCYPLGQDGVDEEAVARQLDIVRQDQEELDRRRREVQERRGPGLY